MTIDVLSNSGVDHLLYNLGQKAKIGDIVYSFYIILIVTKFYLRLIISIRRNI